MVGDRASRDQLFDLRVQIPADAGNREPLCGREVRDALGRVGDGLRGVAIRADLEGILALDLEEVADLGEDTRD